MWRHGLLVGVAVLAFCVAPSIRGQAAKQDKATSTLMQRKLAESQKVLEGLALNDFGAIAKHADELILISKTAEWRVLKTPEYEMFSNSFQRSAGDMVKHAKAKNIDAAALSYVEMTMTCLKCHKHVRDERKTSVDVSH